MSIGERGPFLPSFLGAPPERLIKRGEQGQTFFHWHASICFREGVPSIFRQGLKYVQYRTKIWIFQFIRRRNTNACLVCFYDISVFFCEKAPRLAARGLLRIEPVLWGDLRRGAPAGEGGKGRRKSRQVCGTSLSGWASAGNTKAPPSPENSAPPKSMRTHGFAPIPASLLSTLAKEWGNGYNKPVVQF